MPNIKCVKASCRTQLIKKNFSGFFCIAIQDGAEVNEKSSLQHLQPLTTAAGPVHIYAKNYYSKTSAKRVSIVLAFSPFFKLLSAKHGVQRYENFTHTHTQ